MERGVVCGIMMASLPSLYKAGQKIHQASSAREGNPY